MSAFLVGAGPGPRDLLTLRAAQLLGSADVVLHDRLVDGSVLELIREGAAVIDVGKAPGDGVDQSVITELLVDLAGRHDCVVRLKGGDPFLFGRGGEEALALLAAGIDVEVVPGVTSAFAAAAAAGIPVTHRGLSQSVTVVTASGERGVRKDLAFAARAGNTLVILMGVAHRAQVAADLLGAGLAASTPVAVIERAFCDGQRVSRARLAKLGETDVSSPAVIVVGDVAALDCSRPPLRDPAPA